MMGTSLAESNLDSSFREYSLTPPPGLRRKYCCRPTAPNPADTGECSNECSICHRPFGVLSKKLICLNCNLAVCKLHSGNKPTECQVFCDVCKKARFSKEVSEEATPILDSLQREYQESLSMGIQKRLQLDELDRSIEYFENKVKSSRHIYQASLQQRESQLSSEKEIKASLAESLLQYRNLYDSDTLEMYEEKFNRIQEEISLENSQSEEIIRETLQTQTELRNLIQHLSDLSNRCSFVKFLCPKCCAELKSDVASVIDPDRNIHRDSPKKIRNNRIEKTCSACLII